MKFDLSDCTFNIPTKIDSEDRITNISIVLDYINKNFNTNVIICEQDIDSKIKSFWKPEWDQFCVHMFVKETNNLFHKTKLLNIMAKYSTTPYLISYDSDVLMDPIQYVNARNILKNNIADFCYPFCQALENIQKSDVEIVKNTLSLEGILGKTLCPHPEPPPGGTFFMNKKKFIECGMENERFISYGAEDKERMIRISKLGHRIHRVYGYLYHLEHSRTPNSNPTHSHFNKNSQEFETICGFTKDQLQNYIRTWPWIK